MESATVTGEIEDVFIALGSNLGDSAHTLLKAWEHLGGKEGIALGRLSPPFLSAPVGMTSNHWFTNAVGMVHTGYKPLELLDILLETEGVFGRVRDGETTGYQDRTIDLDLIYFGSTIVDSPRLTLPHLHRTERLFVMAPLEIIAADFVDPVHLQTITEMHAQLREKLAASRIPDQEITMGAWPQD